jgi:hypothetical protein
MGFGPGSVLRWEISSRKKFGKKEVDDEPGKSLPREGKA